MKIKFICISKYSKEEGTANKSYSIVIGLSEAPGEIWKQYFYFKCRRGTFIRKNALKITHDEIIIHTENGRDIQDYIVSIKSMIHETNISVRKYDDNFYKVNPQNIKNLELRIKNMYVNN